MPAHCIPLPPEDMRRNVGTADPSNFDNPGGEPVFQNYGIPAEAYESVFDFGCGCGRVARQLLMQQPRPRRYVGIDPHRKMVQWCRDHLAPLDSNFEFHHHDVFAPSYAPRNTLRLAAPFPAGDREFSLVIANSVFTHLCQRQSTYYLSEIARVLKPNGVAFTSWFFFDRTSFPFLPRGPFSLYTSESNYDEAVIYDRQWFVENVRRCELAVRKVSLPGMAGHQWGILLEKRSPQSVDNFPLGDDGADWLCGATAKAIAAPTWEREYIARFVGHRADARRIIESMPRVDHLHPPELFASLAELKTIKQTWTWRVGRAVTAPARLLKRLVQPS